MGWSFFVPFFPFLILDFQLLQYSGESANIFLTLEFLAAPLGSWWIVFMYHEYFEGGLDELIYSYPLSKWYHGLVRSGVVMVLYILLFLISLSFIAVTILDFAFGPAAMRYLGLTFLFGSVGFFLIVTLKSVVISLSVIAIYTVTEYMTQGDVIPWPHVFEFYLTAPTYKDSIPTFVMHSLFGIVLSILGQIILNKQMNSK
jgi:hypothetical protein